MDRKLSHVSESDSHNWLGQCDHNWLSKYTVDQWELLQNKESLHKSVSGLGSLWCIYLQEKKIDTSINSLQGPGILGLWGWIH